VEWVTNEQQGGKGRVKTNFISPLHNLTEDEFEKWKVDRKSFVPPTMTPNELWRIIDKIPEDQIHMFGMKSHPRNLMTGVQEVSSYVVRPDHTYGGQRVGRKTQDHFVTRSIREIWDANEILRETCQVHGQQPNIMMFCFRKKMHYSHDALFEHFDNPESKLEQIVHPVTQKWIDLNFAIARLNSHDAAKAKCYSPFLTNVKQVQHNKSVNSLTGDMRPRGSRKSGALNRISAVRVEKCGRAVIGASIEIPPGHIGVPVPMLIKQTVPVHVNKHNVKQCLLDIRRGPFNYPGANFVKMRDGRELNLENSGNRNLIRIQDVLIVYAHPKAGSWVIDSRNPTLHRLGLTAKKIIPLEHGNTLVMPTVELAAKGADLDGDEMNLLFPQTLEMIASISTLMSSQATFMRDGKVWMKIVQEGICAGYVLSDEETRLSYLEASTLISNTFEFDDVDFPHDFLESKRFSDGPQFSGREVIMTLLPEDFVMNHPDLVIKSGRRWVFGQITNSTLNGAKGLIRTLHNYWGKPEPVMTFIFRISLLFRSFTDMYCFSAGLFDVMMKDPEKEVPKEFAEYHLAVERLNKYVATHFGDHHPGDNREVEDHIRSVIAYVDQVATNLAKKYATLHKNSNTLAISILSGAKGSWGNLTRMMVAMGQQVSQFERLPTPTSRFHPATKYGLLERYGYISRSLSQGLMPSDIDVVAIPAVEAVVRKNCGTSKIGTLLYATLNSVVGIKVDQAGRVVNSCGDVVQTWYGDDNLESDNLFRFPLDTLSLTEIELMKRYGIVAAFPDVLDHGSRTLRRLSTKGLLPKLLGTDYVRTDQECFVYLTEEKTRSPAILAEDLTELIRLRQLVRKERVRMTNMAFDSCARVPFDLDTLLDTVYQGNRYKSSPKVGPVDMIKVRDKLWSTWVCERLVPQTAFALKLYVWERLSPRVLLQRFPDLRRQHVIDLLEMLCQRLQANVVQAGTQVGVRDVHNLGEPLYQKSLKAPHRAGKSRGAGEQEGNVRVMDLQDGRFRQNLMHIVLKYGKDQETETLLTGYRITALWFSQIVDKVTVGESSIVFGLNLPKCLLRSMWPLQVVRRFVEFTPFDYSHWTWSSVDDDEWLIEFMLDWEKDWETCVKMMHKEESCASIDSDDFKSRVMTTLSENLLTRTLLQGIEGIDGFAHEYETLMTEDGKIGRWVIHTQGKVDLVKISLMPEVDISRTDTSNTLEVNCIMGKYAARESLKHEYMKAMDVKSTDPRHVAVLAAIQTKQEHVTKMKVGGTGKKVPVFTRANWKEWNKQLVSGCLSMESDHNESVVGVGFTGENVAIGAYVNTQLLVQDEKVNESRVPRLPEFSTYVASLKVDGQRLLLVFFKNMIGLIDRNRDVYPLNVPEHVVEQIPASVFMGTVFDGDLCVGRDGKLTYVIFDCYMKSGWPCTMHPLDLRLEIARWSLSTMFTKTRKSQVPHFKVPVDIGQGHSYPSTEPRFSTYVHRVPAFGFGIIVKPIFAGKHVEYLVNVLRHSLPWKTDGLVFSNLTAEAKPFLTDPYAFLKWKPREYWYGEELDGNTIDLEVKVTGNQPLTITSDFPISDYRSTYEFCEFYTMDGKVGLWTSDGVLLTFVTWRGAVKPVRDGQVFEIAWSHTKRDWVFLRERGKRANHSKTVNRNLHLIGENIQLGDIAKLWKS
jgi:DNA-directed RNA polymerase beta' subunit